MSKEKEIRLLIKHNVKTGLCSNRLINIKEVYNQALKDAENKLLKNTTIYNKDCSRNSILAEARYQFIEILKALKKQNVKGLK